MSDASREERAFLSYVYQDDPKKLERELEAFSGQYASDPYDTWWSTSPEAKVAHLIAFEARRLEKEVPTYTGGMHEAGLTSVLYAMERSIDEQECEEMLAGIPFIKTLGDAWLAAAQRLEAAFPGLSFACGKADAIQDFLNGERDGQRMTPFGERAPRASSVEAYAAWKNTVVQEPRRAPANQRGPDETLREANNLWRSWRAYTEVLAHKCPAVLDEALLDLGVLARRRDAHDPRGRIVLERRRERAKISRDMILGLSRYDDSVECATFGDAFHEAAHWFDYLVESGRLTALPALPRLPTLDEAALDPVRALDGFCAKLEKRVLLALGQPRERYAQAKLGVNMHLADLPHIKTPGWDAPPAVRGRAEYEAWLRCGLGEPIQYLVALRGPAKFEALGPRVAAAVHQVLEAAIERATFGMAWEVAPHVFAGQAADEEEYRQDMLDLDAFLQAHPFEGVPTEEERTGEDSRYGRRDLQPLPVPYRVVRGPSLAYCEGLLAVGETGYLTAWPALSAGRVLKNKLRGEVTVRL